MKRTTHYQLLGIPDTATVNEIKSAFRRLAKAYHPDRHPGSRTHEEKFKRLSAAYDVLKDPGKRAAYDHSLHQPRVARSREAPRRAARAEVRRSAPYTAATAAVVVPTPKRDLGIALLELLFEVLHTSLSKRTSKKRVSPFGRPPIRRRRS